MILLLLFLCFTVLPVVELVLLIRIGQAIDWPATVALVLCTGALGAALARWQGLKVLGQLRERMAAGELPGRELFDGALILVAGAVLITPGVITDALGFLLLIPFVRTLIARGLQRWARGRVQLHVGGTLGGTPFGGPPGEGSFGGPPFGGPPFGGPPFGAPPFGGAGDGDVIDVEPRESRPVPPASLPHEEPRP